MAFSYLNIVGAILNSSAVFIFISDCRSDVHSHGPTTRYGKGVICIPLIGNQLDDSFTMGLKSYLLFGFYCHAYRQVFFSVNLSHPNGLTPLIMQAPSKEHNIAARLAEKDALINLKGEVIH